MIEASIWHHEEKAGGWTEYYLLIKDGEQPPISLIMKHNSLTKEIQSDIYTPPDINYTIHDGCDHENDECVLDDPDSWESQDVGMAEKYSRSVNLLEQQVRQQHQAEAMIQRKWQLEEEKSGNEQTGKPGNDQTDDC